MKDFAKRALPVLGMGCYIAFALAGWGGHLDIGTPQDASNVPFYLGIASRLAIPCGFILAMLFSRVLNSGRAVRLFVGVSLVSSALAVVATVDASTAGQSTMFSSVSKGFANASVGLVCYAWCAYDSSEKRTMRICASTLIGVAVFFLVSMFPGSLERTLSSSILALVATCLFIPFARDIALGEALAASGSPLQSTPTLRGDNAEASSDDDVARAKVLRGRRVRFYLSRVAWGAVSGLLIALMNVPGVATDSAPSALLLAVCAIAIAVFIFGCMRMNRSYTSKRDRETIDLCFSVLLPIAATGVLIVPYLFESQGIPRMVFFSSSLAWMLQALFRVNRWTRSLAIDAPLLIVTEDLTVRAARYAAEFSLIYVIMQGDGLVAEFLFAYATGIGFLLAFGSVAAATGCIAAYMVRRYDGQGAENTAGERIASGIDLLSTRFDLTPRECDVAELLAKGYSRPYIEEALCVSKGTAKTHMYHIYQKVGVRSQDALIDVVLSLSHGAIDQRSER